jgi:two-component system sensor histidine kinase HydH
MSAISSPEVISAVRAVTSRGDGEDQARCQRRAAQLLAEHRREVFARTDRMFIVLMLGQWIFAIVLAVLVAPYGWEGKVRTVHAHVFAAIFLGGLLTSLPVMLAWKQPARLGTRMVIACAQMLWSALLIHLTGGRIETHFHVFGSLAFLAFYRDWRVLVPATIVVALDHLLRQIYWPESVYGILSPEWWRFLEHAGWVVFEDVVLVASCITLTREMEKLASERAQAEMLSERERRTEKLAAVGQLAASVGHELRNPLGAVRNAATFVSKKIGATPSPDPKVQQFLGIIDRELAVCGRIISDLLDFARDRTPERHPCPLRPLVDEAVSVLPTGAVVVRNEVPADLPVPNLDKEQFRQIIVNLLQNAVEAMQDGPEGQVRASAEGGGDRPWKIRISDQGHGMPADVQSKIFEPLFTTKTKGTGLGLAVVANLVRSHGGSIQVSSEPGKGTTFTIELPAAREQVAA